MEIATTHEIADLHEDRPCMDFDCKEKWIKLKTAESFIKRIILWLNRPDEEKQWLEEWENEKARHLQTFASQKEHNRN